MFKGMYHHHACQGCGKQTVCGGNLERNYDGWPEVICSDFHTSIGPNPNFLCEDCREKGKKKRSTRTEAVK